MANYSKKQISKKPTIQIPSHIINGKEPAIPNGLNQQLQYVKPVSQKLAPTSLTRPVNTRQSNSQLHKFNVQSKNIVNQNFPKINAQTNKQTNSQINFPQKKINPEIRQQRNTVINYSPQNLQINFKKQKNKWLVIGLPIVASILVFSSAGAAAAYFIQSKNNGLIIIPSAIEKIETTKTWNDFVQIELRPLKQNVSAMQAMIDNENANWKQWINPYDLDNKINENAIKEISSVRVVENKAKIYFEFNLDWNSGIEFSNEFNPGLFSTFLYDYIDFNWKTDANEQISLLLANNPSYANVSAIENELNKVENKTIIKNLIDNNSTIVDLDIKVIEVINSQVRQKTYSLLTSLTVNEANNFGLINPLEGITTNISISINWISSTTVAKTTIQAIIGDREYANLDAVVDELNNQSDAIRNLIFNGDKVSILSFNLSGDNNNYTLQTNYSLVDGYYSNSNLENIEDLNAKLFIEITWNENTSAIKSSLENIIGDQGYNDLNGVVNHLNNNVNDIKALITNNEKISDLTFNFSGNHNNYTLSTSYSLNSGYVSSSVLENINGLAINFNTSVAWIDVDNAKQVIQNIIGENGYNNFDAIVQQLNANVNDIKALINNSNKIANLEFTINGQANNYTLQTSYNLVDGYVSDSTLAIITGLNANFTASISWNNLVQAKTNIQAIISAKNYENIDGIVDELNNNANDIKLLITNNDKIDRLEFLVTGANGNYTVGTKYYAKPGTVPSSGNLESLTQISANLMIGLVWIDPVAAKNSIQTIIGTNGYNSVSEIIEKLNDNVNQIKNLISNNDKINNLNFALSGSHLNYTLSTTYSLNPGYVSNSTLANIAELNANLNANIAWNNTNTAKVAIQTIIGTQGYANNAAIVSKLNDNVNTIKNLISDNDKIASLTFAITGQDNNFTLTTSFTSHPGYLPTSGNLTVINELNANLNVNIAWTNVDVAKNSIQTIIGTEGYENLAAINTKLNDNLENIKTLITNHDKLATLTLNLTGSNNNYSLNASFTTKDGYLPSNGNLAVINNLTANISVSIDWINLDDAKVAIQTIIGTLGYDSVNDITNKLNNHETEIKALISNNSAINNLSFNVSGSNGNFVVVVSYESLPGFLPSSGTLAQITNINANLNANIAWNDAAAAKVAIQAIIGTQGYVNNAAIVSKLNDNVNTIKNLVSDNDKIASLTFAITGQDNNFTLTTSFTTSPGYLPTSGNLTVINELNANLNVNIAWTNVNAAKNSIQAIIGTEGYENLAAINEKLNNNFENIKTLITNHDKLATLTLNLTGSNNNYSLSTSFTTNEGYLPSSGNLAVINNLTANISVSIDWIDWNNATLVIQEIIGVNPYSDTNAIANKLNDHANEIKALISNNSVITNLSFNVNGANNNFTIEASYQSLPGFLPASGTLAQITNINANLLVDIEWIESSETAKNAIQTIIGTNGYADLAAIQTRVNQNNAAIKNLITNNDKINSIEFIVSGSDNNYSIAATYSLNAGYVSNSDLSNIDGLNANLSLAINWINVDDAKTQITEIFGSKRYDNGVASLTEELNLVENKAAIKLLLTDNDKIIDFEPYAIRIDHFRYWVGVRNITLQDGWVQAGTVSNLSEFRPNMLLGIYWNDYDSAKATIQGWINETGSNDLAVIQEYLNTKQTNIMNLLTNSNILREVRYEIFPDGDNQLSFKLTYIRTNTGGGFITDPTTTPWITGLNYPV